MNKVGITSDYASIETTGGITFEKLTQKYNQKLEELHTKYENVHDVVVTCVCGEYNEGENHYEELEIRFKRNETEAECKRRINWQEFLTKENEKRDKARLKELVKKYPDLIKELLK
jgi:cellulose biosynthesis protein BcsQ